MQIRNVHDQPRQIAASGAVVEPGDVVDVDDELGAALLEQPANWAAVTEPKPTKKETDR